MSIEEIKRLDNIIKRRRQKALRKRKYIRGGARGIAAEYNTGRRPYKCLQCGNDMWMGARDMANLHRVICQDCGYHRWEPLHDIVVDAGKLAAQQRRANQPLPYTKDAKDDEE